MLLADEVWLLGKTVVVEVGVEVNLVYELSSLVVVVDVAVAVAVADAVAVAVDIDVVDVFVVVVLVVVVVVVGMVETDPVP